MSAPSVRRPGDIVCFVLVCFVWVIAAGCTVPARTATLERDQARMREELAALQAKVTELEGKVATVNKRVAAGPAGKGTARSEREPERRTPESALSPQAPSTTPVPTALPELDIEGLQREASRQLPGGYEHGIALLRDREYEESIRVMRDFVRTKHGSPFVIGAHYWIGQAHMQLGQFYQAILAFTDVQQRAPRSEYAPAAGLASGAAFLQLGNVTEARRAFERVVAENPGTPEAARATARLQALGRAQ